VVCTLLEWFAAPIDIMTTWFFFCRGLQQRVSSQISLLIANLNSAVPSYHSAVPSYHSAVPSYHLAVPGYHSAVPSYRLAVPKAVAHCWVLECFNSPLCAYFETSGSNVPFEDWLSCSFLNFGWLLDDFRQIQIVSADSSVPSALTVLFENWLFPFGLAGLFDDCRS